MTNQIAMVQKVRFAIKDRALYLALLYRSFSEVLTPEQAEKLARQAIFAYGQARGKRDPAVMTPAKWVDSHVSKGSAAVFESRIIKQADHCEQQMTYCPLVEAWRELGCNDKEIDLMCDIAMEVDRGRAAYHGIPLDITHRIAAGDAYCCLKLRNSVD